MARDTISKLETGRRKAYPTTIRKLAAGLNTAPQMLVGGVEYPKPEGSNVPEEGTEREPGKSRKVGF